MIISWVIRIVVSVVLLFPSEKKSHAQQVQIQPQTVRMIFAGDVMGHTPQVNAAYDSSVNDWNYMSCFQYVTDYIKSFDISVANLEVTLAGPPYKGYPQFSSPDALARDLKKTGFGVLVTANNHCIDRGKQGLLRTISVLDSLGIIHTGTFRDSTERNAHVPLMLEKNGIHIALLNYTYGTNGIPEPKPCIVNYIDTTLIRRDIAKARQLGADFVLAVMHWGIEYQRQPDTEQKNMARFMARNGVDAVIGSHPHVIQPIEVIYPTVDSAHKVPVLYSLGNYVSNQRERYKDGGLMYELTLQKNPRKIEWHYTPVWVHRGQLHQKYQYYILPPDRVLKHSEQFDFSQDIFNQIRQFQNDTRQHVGNETESDYFSK
jgi:poly-gamma-glutamate capsule biosynthesis protein CapA/YwtB (metallophosphatase superfamily)